MNDLAEMDVRPARFLDWKCEKWKRGTITNASRENTRHECADR